MATQRMNEQTWFWNIRFFLILLVVLGNMLEPIAGESAAAEGLYLWIFSFHIPVFAFVMGHYSKNFAFHEEGNKQLLTIVMQYILFQSAFSAADYFLFRTPGVEYSFWIPFGPLWFLIGHIFWRMLLVPLRRIGYALPVSLLLGIGIGYASLPPNVMAVSRTFVFLPFFIAGYYFSKARFEQLAALRFAKPAAWLLLGGLLGICLWKGDFSEVGWLYGNAVYAQLGASSWSAAALRLLWYIVAAVASVAFLMIIPKEHSVISEWGKHSVYVFLLHGFIVKLLVWSGFFETIVIGGGVSVFLIMILGTVVVIALSQPRLAKLTHTLVEPKADGILGLATIAIAALQDTQLGRSARKHV
jgi:fucose 4-O-acetylase-like acetyltransferase